MFFTKRQKLEDVLTKHIAPYLNAAAEATDTVIDKDFKYRLPNEHLFGGYAAEKLEAPLIDQKPHNKAMEALLLLPDSEFRAKNVIDALQAANKSLEVPDCYHTQTATARAVRPFAEHIVSRLPPDEQRNFTNRILESPANSLIHQQSEQLQLHNVLALGIGREARSEIQEPAATAKIAQSEIEANPNTYKLSPAFEIAYKNTLNKRAVIGELLKMQPTQKSIGMILYGLDDLQGKNDFVDEELTSAALEYLYHNHSTIYHLVENDYENDIKGIEKYSARNLLHYVAGCVPRRDIKDLIKSYPDTINSDLNGVKKYVDGLVALRRGEPSLMAPIGDRSREKDVEKGENIARQARQSPERYFSIIESLPAYQRTPLLISAVQAINNAPDFEQKEIANTLSRILNSESDHEKRTREALESLGDEPSSTKAYDFHARTRRHLEHKMNQLGGESPEQQKIREECSNTGNEYVDAVLAGREKEAHLYETHHPTDKSRIHLRYDPNRTSFTQRDHLDIPSSVDAKNDKPRTSQAHRMG